jgi:hypothetical protein
MARPLDRHDKMIAAIAAAYASAGALRQEVLNRPSLYEANLNRLLEQKIANEAPVGSRPTPDSGPSP